MAKTARGRSSGSRTWSNVYNLLGKGVKYLGGKSVPRFAVWLVFILVLAGACLYGCTDRSIFFASNPVSTSILINREDSLEFPAVTICNVNYLTMDYIKSLNIVDFYTELFHSRNNSVCVDTDKYNRLPNVTIGDMIIEGRHKRENFILECNFLNDKCNISDLEPFITSSGLCYTFNRGVFQPILSTNSSGITSSLRVFLNIEQDQYAASKLWDAGARVVIHPQSEPPDPRDQGVNALPGTNTLISMGKVEMIDKTGGRCTPGITNTFSYVRHEFNYSKQACIVDCLHTQIAAECHCTYLPNVFSPDSPEYAGLPACRLKDLCCVVSSTTHPRHCNCPPSCEATSYSTTVSYSAFPALNDIQYLSSVGDKDFLENNLLGVTVFYESLDSMTYVNYDAYTVTALLSDYGGLLGLYLGIGFLTFINLILWFYDQLMEYFASKKSLAKESQVAEEEHLLESKKVVEETGDSGPEGK